MLRRVTIGTSLRIFQYKILNNVLHLNEKLLKFKIASSPRCSFCNSENKTTTHLFYSCNQTKSLCDLIYKSHRVLSLFFQIIRKF